MNGDLTLTRALGGLRIANPDDATGPLDTPSSPDRPADTQAASYEPESHLPHTFPPPPEALPTPSSQLPREQGRDTRSSLLEGQPLNPDSMARSHAPLQQSPMHQLDHERTGGRSAMTAAPRPVSAMYNSRTVPDDGRAALQQNPLRNEPSRSSMYGLPVRTESTSSSIYPSPLPSRESSQKDRIYNPARQPILPPGSGPLPPRRSSKGMGGGYASISGGPAAGHPNPYGPDVPLPNSSEEWKDKGAATGVRREIDANGKTVIRHVKKGVRDFSFGRVLGEGSYSTVYLATDRQTLKEYAIKVLEKKHIIKEKKIKYVNIEKNTLNRLTEHPGIVRLYYTFQDETSLYYVLDLCNGGELLGVLKKTGTFDLECARFYGAQILDAIDYMHSRGVIHRDLKPENVLLDDQMHVKITDFGTAKLLKDPRDPKTQEGMGKGLPESSRGESDEDNRAASFVGTAEYVSPELLTSKNACKASDLWAFGCIIYQLLAGRPPFKAGTEYLTFQKIVNLEYDFPAGFPPAARDLIERCLVLDPARRLTVEHIQNHEFFDGHPFGKVLWRTKAPRLRPYNPIPQEPTLIQLNGFSNAASPINNARGPPVPINGNPRPARIITELPPPTQLDIEWSPVLTRNNERILKLGDLMVVSTPLPNSPHGKGNDHGEGHKKLSRFFGGSTTKKRQRLVMVTSSGRIVLAPAGGDEKRAKQELSLLAPDCTWRSQVDVKGQSVWCVDTGGVHYTFEESKPPSNSSDGTGSSADDWIDSLERAKDLAISQNVVGSYTSDNGFGDMSSAVSSPTSTLGGRSTYPEGFGVSDRSGRNHLSKSQASLEESTSKRNRFSKRQSKNGLGSQF